jgi:hypothetical protein
MADVLKELSSDARTYRIGRKRKSLVEIISELQRRADQPLKQASTLPAEVYTNEDFY